MFIYSNYHVLFEETVVCLLKNIKAIEVVDSSYRYHQKFFIENKILCLMIHITDRESG